MTNRLRCLSVSAVALLLTGALSSRPYAQGGQGVWFSILPASSAPAREQIERLVTQALGQSHAGLSVAQLAPQAIAAALASRAPADLTFVAGRAADVAEFVRTDRFQAVNRLKLEVVNVRLGAAPFYLFTNGEKEANLRQPNPPPRALYTARAGALQPNDVQSLMARVLGTQPAVPTGLNSPDELARRLLIDHGLGGVDVVGIYDEEPSPFLHDFLRAYEVERASVATAAGARQLVQMLVFPTGANDAERDRLLTNRLQPGQGNLAYALVRYDDVAVEGLSNVAPVQKDGVLAVAATRGDMATDSLWVLSNLRSVAGEQEHQRLRRLLGDAYFVGLMASNDFQQRCENTGAGYGAYLLDAQLADRENVVKALAFWSDLVLRSGTERPADAARLRDQRILVESMLRERLDVQIATRQGRANLVPRLAGQRATVREQFSDANGSLFDRALADIQAALQATDRASRARLFTTARGRLVALVEKGNGPACRGVNDLGLFGRSLDPFFYLGLVDAYTTLDTAALPVR